MVPPRLVAVCSSFAAVALLSWPFGESGALAAYLLTVCVVVSSNVAAGREPTTMRLAHVGVAGAALFFAVAHSARVLLERPGLADQLFLVAYGFVALAAFVIARARMSEVDAESVLEAMVFVAGILMVGLAVGVVAVTDFVPPPTLLGLVPVLLLGGLAFLGRSESTPVLRLFVSSMLLAALAEVLDTSTTTAAVSDRVILLVSALPFLPLILAASATKGRSMVVPGVIAARREISLLQLSVVGGFLAVASLLHVITRTETGLWAGTVGAVLVASVVARFGLLIRARDEDHRREVALRNLGEQLVVAADRDEILRTAVDSAAAIIGRRCIAILDLSSTPPLMLAVAGMQLPGRVLEEVDIELSDGLHVIEETRQNWLLLRLSLNPEWALVAVPGERCDPRCLPAVRSVLTQTDLALQAVEAREAAHRARADHRFRALVQDSNDLVILVDPATQTGVMSGPTSRRLLGLDETTFCGTSPLERFHPEDADTVGALLTDPVKSEAIDVRVMHRDGQYRWFGATVRDLSEDEEIAGVLLSLADVHERKMAEVQLAGAENRYRSMIENSTDVFLIVSPDRRLSFASPNIERMLGFQPAEVIGNDVRSLLTPTSAENLDSFLRDAAHDLEGKQLQLDVRTPSAETRCVIVTFSNQEQIAGEEGVLVSVRDITEQVAAEKSMLAAALHDPTTGLLNRSTLFYEVQRGLQTLGSDDYLGALHCDIRDFKNINESLGFETGDDVLREVAARLRSSLRSDDRLARSTGDSFVILTSVESSQHLKDFAQRAMDVFREPITVGGRAYNLRLATGLAHTNDRRKSATGLLEEAALAVRRAKIEDREVVAFEEWMREEATERFELETDLLPGLERGEFSLVYQPLLALSSQRVRSVEALLRWNHPSRGHVSPATFIPLAEKTGAIAELGRWVLQTACRQLADWHAYLPDGRGLGVGVNVSARQLELPGEFDLFRQIIIDSGADPGALTIELTETTMLRDIDWLRSQLENFRSMGITIAVDDFGTGAAGLNHLRDVPFDILKIDKSYVDPLGRTEDAYSLLSGVIELAHGMGATVVAEGIETPDQASELRRMGCDIGQGFYLGRPMDPVRLENWFARGRDGAVASQIDTAKSTVRLF